MSRHSYRRSKVFRIPTGWWGPGIDRWRRIRVCSAKPGFEQPVPPTFHGYQLFIRGCVDLTTKEIPGSTIFAPTLQNGQSKLWIYLYQCVDLWWCIEERPYQRFDTVEKWRWIAIVISGSRWFTQLHCHAYPKWCGTEWHQLRESGQTFEIMESTQQKALAYRVRNGEIRRSDSIECMNFYIMTMVKYYLILIIRN